MKIFEQSDWDYFEDVIVEVLIDVNPKCATFYTTPSALRKIFKLLPERIVSDAYVWGMSDTVFRDNAYTWLLSNWIDKIEDFI